MYSNTPILHDGKAFLPDGKIDMGTSPVLDCGHPRPPIKPGSFFPPWGYVDTRDGKKEYCLDCCAILEKEAIQQVTVYSAYYNLDKGIITDWHGNKLMTIISHRIYKHNFGWGTRFVAIRARDEHGQEWYGKASYSNGECINLRRCK